MKYFQNINVTNVIDNSKLHPFQILLLTLTTFAVATIAIIMMGQVHTALLPVFLVIFLAGFCIVGGQPAINALAATYYPTSLRSTGIGWSVGIGRLGSIVGPVVGGELLRLNWSMDSLFIAAAVPAAIAALTTLAMRQGSRAGGSGPEGAAKALHGAH